LFTLYFFLNSTNSCTMNVFVNITVLKKWKKYPIKCDPTENNVWMFLKCDYITEILLKVTLNAITLTAFACVEVNVYFVLDKHFKCVLIVLAHCNNNLQTDTLSWLRANRSLLKLLNICYIAEKQQIPIVQSTSIDWLITHAKAVRVMAFNVTFNNISVI
jgi:hypothetical protein